jgi:hypothetical protein
MEPPKPLEPRVSIIVSAIGVLITLVWLAVSYFLPMGQNVRLTFLRVLLALWTTVPPIWFLYEWYRFGYTTKQEFDDFKYSQTLARNLWIGIGALIGSLLIGVCVK